MKKLRALLAALLAPTFAIGLALYIDSTSGSNGQALIHTAANCAASPLSYAECTGFHYTPALLAIGVASALFGLAILGFYAGIALVCGSNRIALAWLFPPATFVALIAVALLTLMHAATIGLAIAAAESFWISSAHDWIVWLVVGLGISAAFGVAISAIRSFGNANLSVVGAIINPMDQPRLMLTVRRLSKAVGAKAPDNVVVGMDANFFVTQANVHMMGQRGHLRGRTMFLSAPLLRGLTQGELQAVIAHELSHFANKDLAFSQRFAPVYARLNASTEDHNGRKRAPNPFSIPVKAFTEYMAECFDTNVSKVSRTREFAADERAAEATSNLDMATALLKVSILSDLWRREFSAMLERVHAGRFSRNLSRNFEDQIRYDLDRSKVGDIMTSVMAWHVPHPTDTHPTTEDRVSALGLNAEQLAGENASYDKFFGQATAAQQLDDITNIEEHLTYVYQRMLVEWGVGKPKDADNSEFSRRVLIDLISHMIVVDGNVDEREIAAAEKEAHVIIDDFDPRDLRERCRYPDDLVSIDKLIEFSIDILKPAGFKRLSALLERISKADGMQDAAERQLLERVLAAAELAYEDE